MPKGASDIESVILSRYVESMTSEFAEEFFFLFSFTGYTHYQRPIALPAVLRTASDSNNPELNRSHDQPFTTVSIKDPLKLET